MKNVTATDLYRIFATAEAAQVNLSLHYVEASDRWWAEVHSPAMAERLTTKEHSFPVLRDILVDHFLG